MSKPILSLEYNSTRETLLYSEYGRNVQKLISHAKTIQDRQERQLFVEAIIEMIYQMNPISKNVNEYRLKLWRHVFKMANYDLDVTTPNGEIPTEEDNKLKPETVRYPQNEFNWRHYGHNIRLMIDKALKMEEGPIKKGFVETILAYMKLSYRTWNKEHFVSDDIIISDLGVMSGHKLKIEDDHTIEVTAKSNAPGVSSNPNYKGQQTNSRNKPKSFGGNPNQRNTSNSNRPRPNNNPPNRSPRK